MHSYAGADPFPAWHFGSQNLVRLAAAYDIVMRSMYVILRYSLKRGYSGKHAARFGYCVVG